jgi:hypothetical protein
MNQNAIKKNTEQIVIIHIRFQASARGANTTYKSLILSVGKTRVQAITPESDKM